MKRPILAVIPIVILVVVLGLLALAYANGRKGLGCDADNEPAVQAGKQYFQLLIDKINEYKNVNGKYPVTLDDLNQDILGKGRAFPNTNIKGGTVWFEPDKDRYQLLFYFDNVYVCPVPFSQSRKCTYRSETKAWHCD